MTISYASDRNVASKGLPANSSQTTKYVPVTNSWVRPSGWPALPTITSASEKFAGLYEVYPGTTNYIALTVAVASGRYIVDWGDGSSPVAYNTTTTAQYIYPDPGTTTQYVVTVIPETAGVLLTSVNLNVRYTVSGNTPTLTAYSAPWLDVAAGGLQLDSGGINFGRGGTANVTFGKLEQVKVLMSGNFNSSVAMFSNYFNGLFALRSAIIEYPTSNLNSFSGMYRNCFALTVAPAFPSTTSSSIALANTFDGCRSLVYVPDIPVAINDLTNTFTTCNSLIRAPKMTITGAVFSMTNTFNNCFSLIEVPDMLGSPSAAWGGSSTFANCYSLVSAPYIDTSKCIDMTSWFNGCRSLVSVPLYNTINVTVMTSVFNSCTSLMEIPPFNTSNVTIMTTFANGCTSLTDCPQLNLSNVTTTSSAFSGCSGIIEFTCTFDMPKVTNIISMFTLCTGLQTGPVLNVSGNLTLTTTLFSGCNSLVTTSLFDTSNVTSTSGMFLNCPALTSVPDFNTANVSNSAQMFAVSTNNTGLLVAPTLDLSKSINTASMFQGTRITNVPTYNIGVSANVVNMFGSCQNIRYIPALNLSNATAVTTFAQAGNGVMKFDATGTKVSINISNNKMGKVELESLFNNLGTNTTAQTVTITSNPGADTAIAKTAGITANSNVITMATTTGITTGMYVYGTGIQTGIPVTLTTGTNKIAYTNALTNTPLVNDDRVMFTGLSGALGPALNTTYFVINASSTGFQISTTSGGSAVSLLTGTGTMTIGAPTGTSLPTIVTAVNAGNIIITGVSGLTNAAASLTIRSLNTTVASIKNFTITG